MSQSEPGRPDFLDRIEPSVRILCSIGGISALIWITLAPAEIIISLLPGVEDTLARATTVSDWFVLFQNHWFLGLRSFGLLNLVGAILLVPTVLAIYFLLRQENEALAVLGAMIFFVGVAVYLAGSRAFPMLHLSHQYAAAATDAQRSLLAAAGQVMLVEAENRPGILIIEFAVLVISAAMLRGIVFSKVTACLGMLGSVLMMLLEIAFMPPHGVGMVIAAAGGFAMMTWSFLVGRRLLRIRTS